jgi:hypothetical protein
MLGGFPFYLPGSNIAGSDDGCAGGTCCTREIVLHVHGGLDLLAELDHHDVGDGVPVLPWKDDIIKVI